MQWIAFLLSNPPSQRLRGPLPTVRMTYTDSWVPPHTHDIRTSGKGLVILYVFQPPLWFSVEKKGEISLYPSLSFPISYQYYPQMTSFHHCHCCFTSGLNSSPASDWSRLNPSPSRCATECDGKWSSESLSLSFLWGAHTATLCRNKHRSKPPALRPSGHPDLTVPTLPFWAWPQALNSTTH